MGSTKFPAEHAEALAELRRKHDSGEIDDTTYARHGRAILDEGNAIAHTRRMNRLVALGIAVVLVVGIIVAMARSGSSSDDDHANMNISAQETCKESVKNQLKSPSTAKFSDIDTVSEGGDNYTVSGHVDSENSFGAMIRSSWTCTFDGSYGKATLTEG